MRCLCRAARVHAIGGGLVIFEIQQNSDTTYRVFDWNRAGQDGRPRELHVAQSLASIDFEDFEPKLVQNRFTADGNIHKRVLVNDPLFDVEVWKLKAGATGWLRPNRMQIVAVAEGEVDLEAGAMAVDLAGGQFGLVPACLKQTRISAKSDATLLRVEAK